MTIQELIDHLSEIEQRDLEVSIFGMGEITCIETVTLFDGEGVEVVIGLELTCRNIDGSRVRKTTRNG